MWGLIREEACSGMGSPGLEVGGPDQVPLRCSYTWLHLEKQINGFASQITEESLLLSGKCNIRIPNYSSWDFLVTV